MNELPSVDPAPFPMGSVQAVAARSWRMCLTEDPLGLLAIPYLIAFPVFAFLTIVSELVAQPATIPHDPAMLGMVVSVLPIVLFARVFGEAWTTTRTDAEAHGRRAGYAESVAATFSRLWPLGVVMVAVYLLGQFGFFLFFVPGLVVGVVSSFANQSAVLGSGKLVGSLRESKELLDHNVRAWWGMVAYWAVVFLGLGMVVTIARYSVGAVAGGAFGFALDLALFLPLHIALLVQATCWTLFYRELQARRRVFLAAAEAAAAAAQASTPGDPTAPPASPPGEPSLPDVHAHVG